MMLKFLCCLVVGFVQFSMGTQESGRVRRGASVYPVFQGANSAQMGAEQNNYLFLHDATPFIQYLGGLGGSGSSHSGGAQGSTSYSFRVRAPDGSGGSGALDNNYLNNYNSYTASQPSWNPSPTPATSGWQPSHGSSYGGPVYIPYFGLTTPNFASTGSSPTPAPYSPPASRHNVPTLDANSLLHSAQSSFNSQTALFNALTAGSSRRQYKGGY